MAYFAGGDNGVGAEAFLTTDGASTFSTFTPGGFSYLDVGALPDTKTAVVAGLFGGLRTTDQGATWKGVELGLMQCQSVEAFGTTSIGVAGAAGDKNGVSVSTNGGATFTVHDASPGLDATKGQTARYAAYPSATTWYVSAGSWANAGAMNKAIVGKRRCTLGPNGEDRGTVQKLLSDRVGVCDGGGYEVLSHDELLSFNTGNTTDGYHAAIAKTTDGGKTWTNVFTDNGRMYMNGIHCATEQHCVAAAEGHNVPNPGTYILVTQDGGKTWDVNNIEQGTAPTLMAARDIDGKEGWVLGGTLSIAMQLRAWHTLDTGKTFTNDNKGISGVSVMTTDFASSAHGYAACVTALQQGTMIFYK